MYYDNKTDSTSVPKPIAPTYFNKIIITTNETDKLVLPHTIGDKTYYTRNDIITDLLKYQRVLNAVFCK